AHEGGGRERAEEHEADRGARAAEERGRGGRGRPPEDARGHVKVRELDEEDEEERAAQRPGHRAPLPRVRPAARRGEKERRRDAGHEKRAAHLGGEVAPRGGRRGGGP